MSDINHKKSLLKRTEAEITKSLTDKAVNITNEFGWDFFKAGVVLVDAEDKILLVKEAKVKKPQPDGSKKWVLSDQGKWNLPCGRLRPWEDFEKAASREGIEESGHDFDLGDICHIGFRSDIDNPYVIVIYRADHPRDLHIKDFPDPEEIAALGWFSHDEILQLDQEGQLRNPDLTLTAVENMRKGLTVPPETIMTYVSKFA